MEGLTLPVPLPPSLPHSAAPIVQDPLKFASSCSRLAKPSPKLHPCGVPSEPAVVQGGTASSQPSSCPPWIFCLHNWSCSFLFPYDRRAPTHSPTHSPRPSTGSCSAAAHAHCPCCPADWVPRLPRSVPGSPALSTPRPTPAQARHRAGRRSDLWSRTAATLAPAYTTTAHLKGQAI